MKLLLALLAAAPLAYAACPNACSGHGTCGAFDSCTCHKGWLGGDCSDRQCPYSWSWVTTSRGDINFDGDELDATIYDDDHAFTATSVEYLIDQHQPGGTWESWPSYFGDGATAGADEGHFYMECSNRGLCDRKTGHCDCFPGYTGVACRRTQCPEDCSGHGECLTVGQQATGAAYTLWDKDMSRSCACDAGWSGPSCESRVCPRGDDPLTTGQHNEVQWVDIYTADSRTNGRDGPFAGTIRLTYTDYYGEDWTTDPITVEPIYGYTSDATKMSTMASAVQTALLNLPNNALGHGRPDDLEGVSVTAGYCEAVEASAAGHTLGFDNLDANLAEFFRCQELGTDDLVGVHTVDGATTGYSTTVSLSAYDVNGYSTDGANQEDATATAGAVAAGTCMSVVAPHCVRFAIAFTGTPGDVAPLAVDTSGVTVKNQDSGVWETTAQGAIGVGFTVTDQVTIVTDTLSVDTVMILEKKTSKTTSCIDDDCEIDADVNPNKLKFNIGGTDAALATVYKTHERIKILCGTKQIGTYTVLSVEADGSFLTTSEDMPSCSGDEQATNSQYRDELITVELVSDVIWVNADLRAHIAPGDNYYVTSADGDSGTYGPVTQVTWEIETDKGHPTDVHGRLFLGNPHGYTATNSKTLTGVVKISGTGTTEMSECSDRGVCDPEDGLCKCFSGYTGLACDTQRAISA